jgi:hypothetical protein
MSNITVADDGNSLLGGNKSESRAKGGMAWSLEEAIVERGSSGDAHARG